jgi:hypothetical protein
LSVDSKRNDDEEENLAGVERWVDEYEEDDDTEANVGFTTVGVKGDVKSFL